MRSTEKRRSDPERAESRRRQVLDAAALCFARSGFHGASMAEISKAAGMSAGHIYNYFASKDAIITAFVDQRMVRVSDLLRDLRDQTDPLQAIVDDAREAIAEHLDPAFWGLTLEICAEGARNPQIAAALQAADAETRGKLRELVRTERARRQLAVDDLTLDGRIDTLIALFHGLPLRALHRPQLDQAALVHGFQVAVRALLMT